MPDWKKVAGTRAENARKAMELLENTAGKGYEFTPEEGLDLIQGLQDSLDSLKLVYSERVPDIPGFSSGGMLMATESTTTATTLGPEEVRQSPAESMAISGTQNTASAGAITTNARSDDPLVIPMWAQIKEFVEALPEKQLPAYILHIGDRMYEGALEMVKK